MGKYIPLNCVPFLSACRDKQSASEILTDFGIGLTDASIQSTRSYSPMPFRASPAVSRTNSPIPPISRTDSPSLSSRQHGGHNFPLPPLRTHTALTPSSSNVSRTPSPLPARGSTLPLPERGMGRDAPDAWHLISPAVARQLPLDLPSPRSRSGTPTGPRSVTPTLQVGLSPRPHRPKSPVAIEPWRFASHEGGKD
ncbi:hypothetical protein BT69DRAFT_517695 [Atractiella rhizophila]|nr:hypothetical protein BT69DRAFT_517695 [Atractiella rhizophila]